jgi:uncharacterized protein
MGILKYLLLALVLIWLWYSPAMRSLRGGSARKPAPPPPDKRPAVQAEAMVACAHCGLHLPQEEALLDEAGRTYCGPAHRSAGPSHR